MPRRTNRHRDQAKRNAATQRKRQTNQHHTAHSATTPTPRECNKLAFDLVARGLASMAILSNDVTPAHADRLPDQPINR